MMLRKSDKNELQYNLITLLVRELRRPLLEFFNLRFCLLEIELTYSYGQDPIDYVALIYPLEMLEFWQKLHISCNIKINIIQE